ncbi:zf-HC2 domain-containing protein [Streptomyces sp. NBC_01485]|uniref:zf-HC2 domain-containing protein n=1 Tax=Streptomyces sp. NBC_01485 TaxID=2903884 RepID=UPI002E2F0AA4|nr:zf-HC2 domain-containing protein [Streptomyces sp. NBC_01485]
MLLGAYVLGGLSEPDRRVVEAHLPTCDECRDELARSAPLPGLLRRAPGTYAQQVLSAESEPQSPSAPAEGSLDDLLARVRETDTVRRRRVRWHWLTLAASLIVVAGLAVSLLMPSGSGGPSDPSSRFNAAAGYAVAGRATLTAKPWGTEVSLDVTDLPAMGPFTMQVAADDGRTEQAATWAATPTATARVTGASSVRFDDIRSLVIMDRAGNVLATTRPS